MKKIIAIVALAAAPVLFAQNKLSNSANEVREAKTIQKVDAQQKAEVKVMKEARTAELKKADAEKMKMDQAKVAERKAAAEKRTAAQQNQKSLKVESVKRVEKSKVNEVK